MNENIIMNEEIILNIKETAIFLKCSVSSIRTLIRTKRIPHFRIGSKIYFNHNTLKNWIHNQEDLNYNNSHYDTKVKSII